MELRAKQILCVMISVFAILGAPSMMTFNSSYSLGTPRENVFENSTHIQYAKDEEAILKPSISFYGSVHLSIFNSLL